LDNPIGGCFGKVIAWWHFKIFRHLKNEKFQSRFS